MAYGEMPRDGDGDGEVTNEHFRTLVERSLRAGDYEATKELNRYLLSMCEKKVMTYPVAKREEITQILLSAAYQAAKAVLAKPQKHIELPRNYVVRAMTNKYVDLLRHETAHPELPRVSSARVEDIADRPDEIAEQALRFVEIGRMLREYRREDASQVQVKVYQALAVVMITGCDLRSACEILSFSAVETETVLRTIRRERDNKQSRLWRFLNELTADNDDDTDGGR